MADEQALPPGMQAGPLAMPDIPQVTHDAMNVANPTLDISTFISYKFYQCQSCKKREFAGALDKELEAFCTCVIGEPDPKTKKAKHGVMKLMEYKSVRPGQEYAVPHTITAVPEKKVK